VPAFTCSGSARQEAPAPKSRSSTPSDPDEEATILTQQIHVLVCDDGAVDKLYHPASVATTVHKLEK